MAERLSPSEMDYSSEWEGFVSQNSELNFKKLESRDPRGYELVKAFYALRREIRDMQPEKAQDLLLKFGDTLDEELGEDDNRAATLTPFFEKIRDA